MIKRLFRKIFGIKEPKKPASATAKARLETLIRAEVRAARPRQATSDSGRRRDTGDDANDLLNPLNVLSPLSPISPLNPLNQMDEPFNRQRVENDAVSRAGHHDHGGLLRKEEITGMGSDGARQHVPAYSEPRHNHSHKAHDDGSHRHSYNDASDRHSHSHSHSYSGGHSHSSHDYGSYDSGSSDSGGGGGGGSD